MSALRSAFFDWNLNRVVRVAVSVTAVFLATRLTDGLLVGLGVVVALAIVLDVPWWLYDRYAQSDK
ncbi:hypothetical protein [Saliphagus infecundisoli]|uniref:DUF2892 domain-containing protein n=1 Tax=Saliphagus infecundisoli TaxID=1849069 RepID=A0ABD5QGQ8_9EURY|nr:hypothetical protein [Saliphagus infecundisoli]